ncbi:MAG: hypothetical protein WBN20_12870 [Eudoraea sp.]|uniref:hypothetical protein n=1 Tax=Eudoraea sp. TaxID=1979955 RepID=UPI003C71EB5C
MEKELSGWNFVQGLVHFVALHEMALGGSFTMKAIITAQCLVFLLIQVGIGSN